MAIEIQLHNLHRQSEKTTANGCKGKKEGSGVGVWLKVRLNLIKGHRVWLI